MSSEAKWQTYQEAAVYLLNQFKEHFGLEKIEGEQKVPGLESGTSWAIDGKGIY